MPFFYKGYVATVKYDMYENVFCGKVEGIDADITFEGTSIEELDREFRFWVDVYLDECEAEGIEPEKQVCGKYVSMLPPEFHCKLKKICASLGISEADFLKIATFSAITQFDEAISRQEFIDDYEEDDEFLDVSEFDFPFFYKGFGAYVYKDEKDGYLKGVLLYEYSCESKYTFSGKNVLDAARNFRKCVDEIIDEGDTEKINKFLMTGHVDMKVNPVVHYLLILMSYLSDEEMNEYLNGLMRYSLMEEYKACTSGTPECIENVILPREE